MKRVVFKVSGEALKNNDDPISQITLDTITKSIKKLVDHHLEVIVICGGGNFFRGRSGEFLNKEVADNIGMLSTIMNSLALNDFLKMNQIDTSLVSSFKIEGMIEKYNISNELENLKKHKVIIIAGGVGMPNCSTDFACVERAVELNADTIIMGKNIDYIYDKDPNIYHDAKKYQTITHEELLTNQIKYGIEKLGIMDITALSLLSRFKIRTILYKASDPQGIEKILNHNNPGTIIETK